VYIHGCMVKRLPELLAPGGSFLSALAAFDAGADGVYLGMREFSARKAAANFSLEQLRRIRGLAADRGRRIAVTVNTVVREAEIGRLADTLGWLEALAVDAVIVQDLGVREVAARFFPRLTLHASTQMAVHNSAGLAEAQALGFRRVVLARELPLETIMRLRAEHPGIELEVFIHGALCYSLSGICLASWALTGRSSNRGDCAQICRSLFRGQDVNGHLFSCRDLSLGRSVLSLAEAGVDALKIEGRMKSPEYVFNTVRMYREILDRGEDLGERDEKDLARKSALGFARETTSGWLRSHSGTRLVDSTWPGHRGAVLGTIASVKGDEMTVTLLGDLSLRDGLGLFPRAEPGRAPAVEPLQFSVQRIRVQGREVKFAREGETVAIQYPQQPGTPRPEPGAEIRHLSSRFLDLPEPKEASFLQYRIPVDLAVSLGAGGGRGTLAVQASEAGWNAPAFERTLTVDRAERRKPFLEILQGVFAESGEALFRAGSISFDNRTGLPDDAVFVPPSELKKAKNGLFRHLEQGLVRSLAERIRAVESWSAPQGPRAETPATADLAPFARRESLSPKGDGSISFVSRGPGSVELQALSVVAGFTVVPLPPVMLDEQWWARALDDLVGAHPAARFAVGLSNLAHLPLADLLAAHDNAWFFIDFPLYVANRFALDFLSRRVPRLLLAYAWIEDAEDGFTGSPGSVPVIRIAAGFRPPLFYSLGCFAKHDLLSGCCPDEAARRAAPEGTLRGECPRNFSRDVSQGKARFRVVVRDCVTYLFSVS
jgi:U32 family peptidase